MKEKYGRLAAKFLHDLRSADKDLLRSSPRLRLLYKRCQKLRRMAEILGLEEQKLLWSIEVTLREALEVSQ